jgi:hypothetical protein
MNLILFIILNGLVVICWCIKIVLFILNDYENFLEENLFENFEDKFSHSVYDKKNN